MERLVHRACLELAREFDVGIIGPRGLESATVPGAYIESCALQPLARFLACLQWKTLRAVRVFRPDLIIAGSGLAAPAAITAARWLDAPALCYVHGLDVVADSLLYQSMFVPAIRRCDAILANSRATAGLATARGVPENALCVLHPGTDLPPADSHGMGPGFRDAIGAHGRRILLSVGRLHPRKGLPEFIERSLPAIIAAFPDTVLAIVGQEPLNAVRPAHGETARIKLAVHRAAMGAHVVMTGNIGDELLHRAYRESEILVFPARDLPGDVEGFGMVAIEAAARGSPTVAFSVGGIPDAVAEGMSGFLVPPGDYARFSQAAIAILRNQRDAWRESCRAHAVSYSWEIFGDKLRRICREVLERHESRKSA